MSDILICPNCGKVNDPEEMVYCNILDGVEHPAYMVYAPTCECSHKFKQEDQLIYGDGHRPNVEWFGGIRRSIFPMKSKGIRTDEQ